MLRSIAVELVVAATSLSVTRADEAGARLRTRTCESRIRAAAAWRTRTATHCVDSGEHSAREMCRPAHFSQRECWMVGARRLAVQACAFPLAAAPGEAGEAGHVAAQARGPDLALHSKGSLSFLCGWVC